eukprot:6210502-Pleurochrysis_carterae.AAC.1
MRKVHASQRQDLEALRTDYCRFERTCASSVISREPERALALNHEGTASCEQRQSMDLPSHSLIRQYTAFIGSIASVHLHTLKTRVRQGARHLARKNECA